ncbi:MAG: DUF1062 domain-containing protein [Paracoccaceae bacterium]
MTGIIFVHWAVTALHPPRPWRHCPTCGDARPFLSSGRIRLNANGQRLDAWLIYKCAQCKRTWNRPVADRVPRAAAPDAVLEGWQQSLPDAVRVLEFDHAALSRFATRIDAGDAVSVVKAVTAAPRGDPELATIALTAGMGVSLRLDRLLAQELGLSRSRLSRMARSGQLSFPGRSGTGLNRAVTDGVVALALGGLNGEERRAMITALTCETA